MMICFEGPSGSGKTLLIEEVANILKIPVWRRPPEINEVKEKYKIFDLFVLDELSILNAIDFEKVDLIVDRHPAISEWVYSKVRDRESRLPWLDLSYIHPESIFIYLPKAIVKKKKVTWDQEKEEATYREVMIHVTKQFPVLTILPDLSKTEKVFSVITFIGLFLYDRYSDLIQEFLKEVCEEVRCDDC